MRLLDQDEPIDPDVAESLDAIDAVLAGEPVDARFAELAEVALLLAADRPTVPDVFAQSMDERVSRRFASGPVPADGAAKPRRRWWELAGFWEATGGLAAAVALIVGLVVVVGGGHGGSSGESSSASTPALSSAPAHSSSSAGTSSSSSAGTAASGSSAPTRSAAQAAPQARSAASGAAKEQPALVPPVGAASGSVSGAPTLQPPMTGRKVVQGAQLSLSAAPNRVDAVAQQVYDVVGAVNGVVERSSVTQTGGPGGYAEFELSVPSGSLGQAMSRLSSLNYARVLSRTDSSQDITDQYGAAQRRLADARTLRTSLLKQLARATTTEQIDSLKAQIRDAEASISSDQATLNRLNHQVGSSQLSLEIIARSATVPATHHGGSGFGIGSAAHDAERVLTVAAGAALIGLAALLPVALLAGLAWWLGAAFRRRRREQALDAA